MPFWADPARHLAQQVNTNDGGLGLYWLDSDGHVLEILTRALRRLAATGKQIAPQPEDKRA